MGLARCQYLLHRLCKDQVSPRIRAQLSIEQSVWHVACAPNGGCPYTLVVN